MELVDTSDLKFDSILMSTGSNPVVSKDITFCKAKMMELVDMLGLGSSSL